MAAAAPFGLAIGLTMGALGGGGAVLAVPVLVYVLDQDVHAATTASLVVVAAAALAGGAGQADRHEVCWPQVAVFAPTAVVGAVVGSIANESVSDSALMVAFALLMLGAAAFMWRSGEQDASDAACPPLQTVRTTAAGITVGALTGFFGVGGGFLVVPMLALVMSFPVRRAIGTSLVIVAVVSRVALGVHLARGADVELGVALAMGASAAVGGYAGSRLSARLPSAALGHAFAVLVVAVADYVIGAESLG